MLRLEFDIFIAFMNYYIKTTIVSGTLLRYGSI